MSERRKKIGPESPYDVMWITRGKLQKLENTHFRAAMKIVRQLAIALASIDGTFPHVEVETTDGIIETRPLIGFVFEARYGFRDSLYIDPEGTIFNSMKARDGTVQLRDVSLSIVGVERLRMVGEASGVLLERYRKATETPQSTI